MFCLECESEENKDLSTSRALARAHLIKFRLHQGKSNLFVVVKARSSLILDLINSLRSISCTFGYLAHIAHIYHVYLFTTTLKYLHELRDLRFTDGYNSNTLLW
jgi:hypothetical protein